MASYSFYRHRLPLKEMWLAGAVMVAMTVLLFSDVQSLQKKVYLSNWSIKKTKETAEMKSESPPKFSLLNKGIEKKIDKTEVLRPERFPTITNKGKGTMKTIRQRKLERPPMIICVGIKKCGTGGLNAFLNMHPYFNSGGERFTKKEYFNRYEQHPKTRKPSDIRDFYGEDAKNLKAIMMICNPVDRFFSDFVHIHEVGIKAFPEKFQEVGKYKSVSDYVKYAMETFSKEVLPYLGDINEVVNYTTFNLLLRNNEQLQPLMIGLFVYHIKGWITSFPKENLLVVHGEDFIEAPWTVLQNVEKFLQIDPFFSKDLFHFDEEKGFYCPGKCLQSGKGKTRSKNGSIQKYEDLTKEDREVLRAFYAQYNTKLFELIGKRYAW